MPHLTIYVSDETLAEITRHKVAMGLTDIAYMASVCFEGAIERASKEFNKEVRQGKWPLDPAHVPTRQPTGHRL